LSGETDAGLPNSIMSRFHNLEFGEEFDRQLQSNPQPGNQQTVIKNEAHFLAQAQSAFESGLFDEALRHYAKVLEYNPANVGAWAGQVRMLIELNELQEAKRWADKALEKFPNEPELLAAKAVALARLGDLEAAIAYSDASIEERGETPYIWLARGDVQLAREEKRAGYCFDKALAMAAKDWFIHWLAARIHYYYRKFAQALKLVQQALTLNSGQGILWLQLGFCQQALGLVGPARLSFQHAREFSLFDREVDAALRNLYRSGIFGKVRNQWRRLFNR
jgi:tetratricopeptide (TPR) repeat protein